MTNIIKFPRKPTLECLKSAAGFFIAYLDPRGTAEHVVGPFPWLNAARGWAIVANEDAGLAVDWGSFDRWEARP